jgi:hypothetical protein
MIQGRFYLLASQVYGPFACKRFQDETAMYFHHFAVHLIQTLFEQSQLIR